MNTALIEKIDAIEERVVREFTATDGVVIPRCLAQSIREVLEKTWQARVGGIAGHAKACAVFLDACLEANP